MQAVASIVLPWYEIWFPMDAGTLPFWSLVFVWIFGVIIWFARPLLRARLLHFTFFVLVLLPGAAMWSFLFWNPRAHRHIATRWQFRSRAVHGLPRSCIEDFRDSSGNVPARDPREHPSLLASPRNQPSSHCSRHRILPVPTGRLIKAWHEVPGPPASHPVSQRDTSCGVRRSWSDRIRHDASVFSPHESSL